MIIRKKRPVKPKTEKIFKRQSSPHAIFIDGVSVDRATARLGRKINWKKFIASLSSGSTPILIRYYTIIPFEDDSRHRSFLNALEGHGMAVICRRLPPKGVQRQVSSDLQMACDIVSVAAKTPLLLKTHSPQQAQLQQPIEKEVSPAAATGAAGKTIVVVCPSRELSYPLQMAADLGCETVAVDFDSRGNAEILKAVRTWIDLSDSEDIWL